MLSLRIRTVDSVKKLRSKAKAKNITNLRHAGAAMRLVARRSIRRRKTASMPGLPPNTRRGQLKRSIAYAVLKGQDKVLVGPQFEVVGQAGRAHEFGGRFRRERYPKRPFMGPALMQVKDRLPAFWAGSIR